jgi:hypothetical protein
MSICIYIHIEVSSYMYFNANGGNLAMSRSDGGGNSWRKLFKRVRRVRVLTSSSELRVYLRHSRLHAVARRALYFLALVSCCSFLTLYARRIPPIDRVPAPA